MAVGSGDRSNEGWVQDLRTGGETTRVAHADLRVILHRALTRAFARRLGNAMIDDLVQDALIKLTNKLADFRGDSRFVTWAVAIAIRTAYTELRKARWSEVSLEDLGLGEALNDLGHSSPEGDIDRKRIVQAMHRVISSQVTEKQRTALLAELAGMPQSVLCERLGTSRNAVYKLGHDARKALNGA